MSNFCVFKRQGIYLVQIQLDLERRLGTSGLAFTYYLEGPKPADPWSRREFERGSITHIALLRILELRIVTLAALMTT